MESTLSSAGTRVTLVEEAIYNRLIGLKLPNPLEPLYIADNRGNNNSNSNSQANQASLPIGGFTPKQFNTISAFFQSINTRAGGRQTYQPVVAIAPAPIVTTPQFRPRDIRYFNPDPNIPLVKVKDSYNIYYNIFSFTNRVKVKATTIDPTLIRLNLDSCLLRKANNQFTN